ncbi:hypothetical protein EF847_03485 [Actinobacteria bacterium YIM 96077]|uniref:Serine protease n=1 Tax=Phytoactinopolyspora halophila TaxID=1981511 RepID=A0A329R4K5_9ACTN|nr:hypothetical protein [Phytoactinopolyspora halophila]AYY11910.1 hypothetical protein EF847_03485 [Actinobacteria bacterium YIM 96077]RAW18856.1 hypothetical protein DPM12_02025 [Phytoactinopolyspora halophila]
MHIEAARQFKNALLREVRAEIVAEPGVVAAGIWPLPEGGYGLAVRCSGDVDRIRRVLARMGAPAPEESDLREVGMISPLSWNPADLQKRVRPVRPGLSVAHGEVTAGTIGAFVIPDDGGGGWESDGTGNGGDPGSDGGSDRDGRLHVLSNNHVLADSDRGIPGDAVLQPGPADGGVDPGDRIGVLDRMVTLQRDASNLVDAATARLDGAIETDVAHPIGVLAGWSDVHEGIEVAKVGRTTGITRGDVSAFEVDGLVVEFPGGPVEFHGQIEVSGGADGAFSSGGDSGSVVYREDRQEAVGLLFAGSERGGPAGTGLTYCNPFGAVLDELGVRLASGSQGGGVPEAASGG